MGEARCSDTAQERLPNGHSERLADASGLRCGQTEIRHDGTLVVFESVQTLSPLSAERGRRLYNAQTAHLGMRRDPWSGHTQHTCACFARSARAPGTRARELSRALLRANFERGAKQCRCPCGVGALWQPETFLRTAFGVSAPVGLAWRDGGWTRQNCNARWAPGNYGAGCAFAKRTPRARLGQAQRASRMASSRLSISGQGIASGCSSSS